MSIRNALLITAAVAAASPAMAGYTPIQVSGEPSLNVIFAANYGALSGGDMNSPGFTTALGYTFTRVMDFGTSGSGPTNLHNVYDGTTSDARLQDGTAEIKFLVKHAGNTNRIGWTNQVGNPTGASYNDVIGSSGDAATTLSSNFQLVMNVNGSGSQFWGSDQLAGGGNDHFVTWFVQGNGRKFWVIGSEDLNLGDADYNDWVGELSVVPLPPAAWAGLSTLAGVAGIGYVRRRKNAVQ